MINDVNILPLDQSAARRLRALLVLRYKVVRTDLVADLFQRIQILVLGMQGFTIFAVLVFRSTNRNASIAVGNGREGKFFETAVLCKPGEIVDMQALHDNDHHAAFLVIEPAE